ncbi:MAG: hypothetical protein ACFFDS_00540 [Candidatus Thorarchaeota archaeon]
MYPHSPQSSVPPDKLVQQLIMQAIQAFYIQDYETGIYFLEQIRTNLPRYMYQLNPQNRALCKEIVKVLQDGSLVPDRSSSTVAQAAADTHPGLSGISEPVFEPQPSDSYEKPTEDSSTPPPEEPSETTYFPPPEESQPPLEPVAEPDIFTPVDDDNVVPLDTMGSDFMSELSSAVDEVRSKKDKKKKKLAEDLTGSMDELEDFDF